jgi:hypothetical protein
MRAGRGDRGESMSEHKRRRSQNSHLFQKIVERLRDYEPEEVVVICNKFRARRKLPLLDEGFLEKVLPPKA